jgi:hypothetical protein
MRRNRSAQLAGRLIAAALPLLVAGCSQDADYGETGRINGRLTFEGEVLAPGHGVIFMDPIKGFLAYGETDIDGYYDVSSWNNGNMPAGTYKVYIGSPEPPAPRTDLTPEEAFDHPELVDPPAPPMLFPRKYLDKDASGLEFTVKAGENEFNIDLKKE